MATAWDIHFPDDPAGAGPLVPWSTRGATAIFAEGPGEVGRSIRRSICVWNSILDSAEHVARTTVVRADYCGVGDGVCRVLYRAGEQVGRMAWASPESVLRSAIEFPTDGPGRDQGANTGEIVPCQLQLSTAKFAENSSQAAKPCKSIAFGGHGNHKFPNRHMYILENVNSQNEREMKDPHLCRVRRFWGTRN
jgi:hypothetical protein